ncbi:DUF771 domain-containing protein [Limosilactobacillus reuteri]|uniref:DUF771 domain-containing protein n=2 Tax=Limosilactobacillus reuteri TaxID=1598 RepID=UPI001E557B99|nr:DUF771 domain-containing protein [Limosilactobacillus reuteri]MCC4397883.1 DUF771 domain-containing protein [Limosilactobacillus reuteri]MCC4410129.1 DUF771 domain-containing protein [Limosilactobacillus reuteri]
MKQLSIQISAEPISSAVREVIKEMNLVPADDLKEITWSIDEFRKKCCGGKSANWVRTFIFDEFPETDYANGGWCIAPHKQLGQRSTTIFAYEATRWMEAHKYDIDWNARLVS